MKKVGIVTIHRHFNPGCPLQAYGLQEAISKFGYESEIIDYYCPNTYHMDSPTKEKVRKSLGNLIKMLFCGKQFRYMENKFNNFFSSHLKLSGQSYKTVDDLLSNPPNYDLYCIGSDQVWNPTGTKMDPVFFGGFVPPEKQIVSYASSFGVNIIPEKFKDQYKKELSRFRYLSVRETSGVQIIKNVVGKEAELVIDPTLLLTADEWFEKLPAQNKHEPYILCYGCPYPNTYIEHMALQIQKQTGLNIIHLYGLPWQRFDKRIKHIYDVGPLEFLGWIKNASLVLTTSFHGTIFSINFKKPFYSIYPNEERGCRQLNILNHLGLESRAIKVGTQLPETGFFDIDFNLTHKNLDSMRDRSFDYLDRMLSICGD